MQAPLPVHIIPVMPVLTAWDYVRVGAPLAVAAALITWANGRNWVEGWGAWVFNLGMVFLGLLAAKLLGPDVPTTEWEKGFPQSPNGIAAFLISLEKLLFHDLVVFGPWVFIVAILIGVVAGFIGATLQKGA